MEVFLNFLFLYSKILLQSTFTQPFYDLKLIGNGKILPCERDHFRKGTRNEKNEVFGTRNAIYNIIVEQNTQRKYSYSGREEQAQH